MIDLHSEWPRDVVRYDPTGPGVMGQRDDGGWVQALAYEKLLALSIRLRGERDKAVAHAETIDRQSAQAWGLLIRRLGALGML